MLSRDRGAGPRSVRTPTAAARGGAQRPADTRCCRRAAPDSVTAAPASWRYSAAARIWAAVHTGHSRRSGNPGTPASGNRCRFGRTVPVAQRQEPHRRLDRRQRVILTDVDVAVVNLHRQLPEPVIGHARRPLHPRRAKSGSPTDGQPLRSALLRATPPLPPAPHAARSIAVHRRAGEQNSRRASRAQGRPDTPPPAERSPPEVALPSVGSPSGPLPSLRRQQPHTGLGRPGAASFSTVAVRYGCRATSRTRRRSARWRGRPPHRVDLEDNLHQPVVRIRVLEHASVTGTTRGRLAAPAGGAKRSVAAAMMTRRNDAAS